jgi:hypothetical protein
MSDFVQCRVCRLDDQIHSEIDSLLRAGKGIDYISKKYGVGRDSVWRHRRAHVVVLARGDPAAVLPKLKTCVYCLSGNRHSPKFFCSDECRELAIADLKVYAEALGIECELEKAGPAKPVEKRTDG